MSPGAKAVVVVGTLMLLGQLAIAAAAPPRRKGALLAWLRAGTYRGQFVGEPEVHASTPEGRVHAPNVRTYYSPTLADDLRAGRRVFRPGAAMIKELYAGSTDRPTGYSVMIKVARRSGAAGRGWLFYETLDATNRGTYFGRGLRVCAGCHRTGLDFLRSEFRP